MDKQAALINLIGGLMTDSLPDEVERTQVASLVAGVLLKEASNNGKFAGKALCQSINQATWSMRLKVRVYALIPEVISGIYPDDLSYVYAVIDAFQSE